MQTDRQTDRQVHGQTASHTNTPQFILPTMSLTSPRIQVQLPHCCCICEQCSGFHNATRCKWESIKNAGLFLAGMLGGIPKDGTM